MLRLQSPLGILFQHRYGPFFDVQKYKRCHMGSNITMTSITSHATLIVSDGDKFHLDLYGGGGGGGGGGG